MVQWKNVLWRKGWVVVPNVGDLLLETWLCDKNLFLDESSAGVDWKKNMYTGM